MKPPLRCTSIRPRPVRSIARLGCETAPFRPPITWVWVNATPRRTSRSMFGVWISVFPNARIVLNV